MTERFVARVMVKWMMGVVRNFPRKFPYTVHERSRPYLREKSHFIYAPVPWKLCFGVNYYPQFCTRLSYRFAFKNVFETLHITYWRFLSFLSLFWYKSNRIEKTYCLNISDYYSIIYLGFGEYYLPFPLKYNFPLIINIAQVIAVNRW